MNNQVLSIEQMQELIELGIDTSNASMCWVWHQQGEGGYHHLEINRELYPCIKDIPTFTLQDILELIPPCIEGEPIDEFETEYTLDIDFMAKNISYYDYIWDRELISFDYNNLLDGAFQMLKWCKENTYI